jgi:hypothetical protein
MSPSAQTSSGLHRDHQKVRPPERDAQRLIIAAAGVDDRVVVLGR